MIQALWLTTGTLGIVMTMERDWDSEGLYLLLLALFFPPGGLGGYPLLLFVFTLFFIILVNGYILFQDGAVGRVLT